MIFSIHLSTYFWLNRSTYLAVLHNVQLSKPCLVKGVAGCVNNMAESILLCQDKHRVEESFHRFDRLDKTGTGKLRSEEKFM